ncbi:MAG TPA: hypothetical protein VFU81_13045, partial [Thermomicrobiales bacterium]|nr:hypothetical protein [Thermomicrobiales bacterium]
MNCEQASGGRQQTPCGWRGVGGQKWAFVPLQPAMPHAPWLLLPLQHWLARVQAPPSSLQHRSLTHASTNGRQQRPPDGGSKVTGHRHWPLSASQAVEQQSPSA